MPEIADLCRLMVLQVKPFWNRDCRYSRSFLHKLKMCPNTGWHTTFAMKPTHTGTGDRCSSANCFPKLRKWLVGWSSLSRIITILRRRLCRWLTGNLADMLIRRSGDDCSQRGVSWSNSSSMSNLGALLPQFVHHHRNQSQRV